ncbi:MAG: tRNA (adenosine(37)-N6)-threonylcarbamoyltransferase complex dimerization subunit type 1 TsaB [Coxiellaceae bacterium]|nr:tRNA (adenosine(37)-N6)-threonylcarbamoyltransferase complex dimerization subunit type 1 TsaB [Coxiellaceae bacterium]
MSNILAFDTATNACSVALQVGDLQLDCHQIAPRQHSQLLLPTIDDLLSRDDLSFNDLDAIACGIGPGSFMGVRLAVSVAQGLAYACQKPVVGVSTLQILAQTAHERLGYERVIAAWDARMDEIYCGFFTIIDGVMQPVVEDQLIAPGTWQCKHEGDWQLVGNAWSAYADAIKRPDNCQLTTEGGELYPEAKSLLSLADDQWSKGKAVSALELVPNYIRQKVVYS